MQARRDRDYHREALHTFENKVLEEQRCCENEMKMHKELEEKNSDMVCSKILYLFCFCENFFLNSKNFKFKNFLSLNFFGFLTFYLDFSCHIIMQ